MLQAGEIAQQVKVFTIKPEDLSSKLGIHIKKFTSYVIFIMVYMCAVQTLCTQE